MDEKTKKGTNCIYDVCDRCVFCGRPVPEGVMVCPICEEEIKTSLKAKGPKEKEKKI